ncbi:PDR/VanB family oxidoreductase [Rhodococcus qingshengii]|uniref:PDR/VanB family oxidoreductase n=1 Tax=Rhodococcus qingshengii TaxID=334542 RepID=UPI001BEC686F|nr:PDR/VanB family oxidoreductase [Rhodococcus qingshengii]MBT2273895.1 oxidoreductase [Rhodococcus qingshengii]
MTFAPSEVAASADVFSGDDSGFQVLVRDVLRPAEGIVELRLTCPDGGLLPAWDPGAHIDIHTGGAVRQYSLCGDHTDRTAWHVGVLRDPQSRGGSAWVHDTVGPHDVLRVSAPRNHFRLEKSPRYLFIAGGIGITPIKAMITQVEREGAEWTLLYGGRSRSSMAFLDELCGHGDRVIVQPRDETGLLDLPAVLGVPQSDTLVYCCGPEMLLQAVERESMQWPEGALHIERFAAAAPEISDAGDRPFRVTLSRLGKTIDVPHDRSILEAVTDAGADVLSSCEDGICGTCMTTVLSGTPDHRDSVLSAKERTAGDCMLVCVSRAESDELVLDL